MKKVIVKLLRCVGLPFGLLMLAGNAVAGELSSDRSVDSLLVVPGWNLQEVRSAVSFNRLDEIKSAVQGGKSERIGRMRLAALSKQLSKEDPGAAEKMISYVLDRLGRQPGSKDVGALRKYLKERGTLAYVAGKREESLRVFESLLELSEEPNPMIQAKVKALKNQLGLED
jgi:hypothetical protein